MADNMPDVQFALKAIDRSRQFTVAAIAVLFVLVFVSLAMLQASAGADRVGPKMLFVATATQMLFAALCTVIVAFYVTRMTKAVLRAIELTRR